MGKSSKDKRDAYYRLAKEQGWRARSAFKLLQLDEEFDLFTDVSRVVDLCAAPGSWSQVLSRVLIKGERLGRAGWLAAQQDRASKADALVEELDVRREGAQLAAHGAQGEAISARKCEVKIVAIDLQPMSPLEGITMLQADITHPSTIPRLLTALGSAAPASHPVDLVISDGAPDVTGLHDLDIYVQSQLLWAALNLALCVLKPGGKFVAKIFRGKDVDLIYAQLRLVFRSVHVAKPRSSRASSLEAFVVCEDFRPIPGFEPSLENPIGTGNMLPEYEEEEEEEEEEEAKIHDPVLVKSSGIEGLTEIKRSGHEDDAQYPLRWIAPFLACGDLSTWDADATHKLPEGHVSLGPVQPPTAPPYKKALELRKASGGAYGKTKLP